jgi:hypothetical protein
MTTTMAVLKNQIDFATERLPRAKWLQPQPGSSNWQMQAVTHDQPNPTQY